jgi:hypothetical protein
MDMVAWKNHQLEMLHGVMVKFFVNIILKKTSILLGFDIPANYDDVGLNCGGLGVQKSNGKSMKYKFPMHLLIFRR